MVDEFLTRGQAFIDKPGDEMLGVGAGAEAWELDLINTNFKPEVQDKEIILRYWNNIIL